MVTTFKIIRDGAPERGGFDSVDAAVDSLREEFPGLVYDAGAESATVWADRASYDASDRAGSDAGRLAFITRA